MTKLTKSQIKQKRKQIHDYIYGGKNASDSSGVDANANVEQKNIATLSFELNKDINIQLNDAIIYKKIKETFDQETADEYVRQLEHHEIYVHDQSAYQPYCVAIDSTPFLNEGLQSLGGDTTAPKHLGSYCGGYINLLYAIASQFAGAVADVSFLKDFHYFAKKDLGDNYLEEQSRVINSHLSQVIYSINMPASSRGYQSIFYNTSVFDFDYFKGLYEFSYYPDGSKVIEDWEGINKLQKYFLTWFNKERSKSLLTFPVITSALKLDDDNKIVSEEWKDFIAKEFSEGNSFFVYMDTDVTSLSSCCRLRNNISDQLEKQNTFSYTLGGTGISTGSKNVITINMNRLVQDGRDLKEELHKLYKYQIAFELWYRELYDAGMLPVYEAGYISLDKQFLTIGLNGTVEAGEFLGLTPNYNDKYTSWLSDILKTISEENKLFSEKYSKEFGHKIMFNTEYVPAENASAKMYNWDKETCSKYKIDFKGNYPSMKLHEEDIVTTFSDESIKVSELKVGDAITDNRLVIKKITKGKKYKVPESRNLYNSYFYPVEDEHISIIDKIRLHGKETIQYLDGGSALHLNLEEHLTEEGFKKLMDSTALSGCNYWTYNVPQTICNECGKIDKRDLDICPYCHSKDVDKATRIIGYLKRISSFSSPRQIEANKRVYHKTREV